MMISEAGNLESLANCAGKLAKYDSTLLILNTDTLRVCKCFNLGAHNNSVHEDRKLEDKKELTKKSDISLFCSSFAVLVAGKVSKIPSLQGWHNCDAHSGREGWRIPSEKTKSVCMADDLIPDQDSLV